MNGENSACIFRYEMKYGTTHEMFSIPVNAVIVDAVYQLARNAFSIYAEVRPGKEVEERTFEICATGETMPDGAKHIRSIIMPDGFHVFHVYEVTKCYRFPR